MEHTVPLRLVTILDYWRVIRHYWRIIGILVCLSVAGTWVWCKNSPRLYEAKVTMILTGKSPAGGGDGISFGGDKERGSANVMEMLHAMLVSRKIAETIVTDLNLKEYYGVVTLDQAISLLQSETDVRASPFKTYEITVLTKDPEMVAVIANTYVPNVDRLYKEVRRSVAKQQLVFLEHQIAEKVEKLAKLKYKLKEFRTKSLALTSEVAKAAMEDEVNLHSEIVGREAQLAVLRSYASPNHTMIIQLQMQIAELRQQLTYLEESRTRRLDAKQSRVPMSEKLFTELDRAPRSELDILGLMGQIRLEEASSDMLAGMIEQARFTEAYDVPTIQQLDRAIPAKFPSKPKTRQSLKAAAALSLILGIMLAFFLNHLRLTEGAGGGGEPRA